MINPNAIRQCYATLPSPLGEIVLTALEDGSSGKGLTGIYLPMQSCYKIAQSEIYNPKPFQQAFRQLNEYFEGKRQTFDLAFTFISGTAFQKQIWQRLSAIDFGKTTYYGAIAKAINRPEASRAVGMAIGKNPLSIIVPCHRVIGSTGKLTGYAGGIEAKQWLLNHEAFCLK